VRVLVDPDDPEDLLQSISTSQWSTGSVDVPAWDPSSQKKVRDALLAFGSTLPDLLRVQTYDGHWGCC
jgi:hypothetical protein